MVEKNQVHVHSMSQVFETSLGRLLIKHKAPSNHPFSSALSQTSMFVVLAQHEGLF